MIALFFFFQAEDGIRDVAVTGVQTCALPISDTNTYIHPSLSSDGRALVATQSLYKNEFSVAPASSPDEWHPLTLSSRRTVWRWDWTADGRLLLPQGGDIRIVDPGGGETLL